jgi:hypothetical protein
VSDEMLLKEEFPLPPVTVFNSRNSVAEPRLRRPVHHEPIKFTYLRS